MEPVLSSPDLQVGFASCGSPGTGMPGSSHLHRKKDPFSARYVVLFEGLPAEAECILWYPRSASACVYIHIYAYIVEHLHTCIDVRICRYVTSTCTYQRTRAHMCIYIYIYTSHDHTYIHVYIYIYIYTHCIYMYICMRIQSLVCFLLPTIFFSTTPHPGAAFRDSRAVPVPRPRDVRA